MSDDDLVAISHLAAIRNGWSEEKRCDTVTAYEEFLTSAVAGSNAHPSLEVDELWHLHILNSVGYSHYCQQKFGFYVHHVACVDRDTYQALTAKIGGRVPDYIRPPEDNSVTALTLAQCGPGDRDKISVALAQCGVGKSVPPLYSRARD